MNGRVLPEVKAWQHWEGSRRGRMAQAGREAVLRWLGRATLDLSRHSAIDELARPLLERAVADARVEDPEGEGTAEAHAVAQGMVDALGELALLIRYAVPAPKVEAGPWSPSPPHRPGSLPFAPTEEQLRQDPLLRAAAEGGLSESQVVTLLARRVGELQAMLYGRPPMSAPAIHLMAARPGLRHLVELVIARTPEST